MTLAVYNRKRNFRATAEPRGKRRDKRTRSLRFVVQKHDASRLHYDFRLELDGVLKSWAVPKGPSMNPSDKSLAVQVEDHPLDYRDFEGTIPQGEYGGGTVMLWDRGTWTPLHDPEEGLQKGKLHFRLTGERLQGEFSLVRMKDKPGEKGKNWLLIKLDDQAATNNDIRKRDTSIATGRTMSQIAAHKAASKPSGSSGTLPQKLSPQLATLVDAPPSGKQWIHEIKFDGYRMLAWIESKGVRLRTRNGHDWTDKFPAIATALAKLKTHGTIIDAEVVALDQEGKSDFQALQAMLKDQQKVAVTMYAFDLLYADYQDWRNRPLLERKDRLKHLLDQADVQAVIRYSDHTVGDGKQVVKEACRMNLEGIISKKVDASYVGKRSSDWVKSKCQQRQEFVIIGYTQPQGGRSHFGALLLGVQDKGKLRYVGRVGTGFNEQMLASLYRQLSKRTRETPPANAQVPAREKREATWTDPDLICEVRFTGWTRDHLLRHPAFIALRSDKSPKQVVIEKPIALRSTDSGVTITHPDKVLYPGDAYTKQHLVDYYRQVAERMLPHVVDRPLALVRCPSGQAGKCFFQRNYATSLPAAIQPIDVSTGKKHETHVSIESEDGLLAMVQISALEVHPWGCAPSAIERPDRVIFDLDPDESVPWKQVIQVAQIVHKQLDDLQLPTFIKTSGGKGLHIVVPLKPTIDWDNAKSFCEAIVKDLATSHPQQIVANMRKDLRRGKIYIDYHRNGRGATAVAAYSTRAKAGAPVSMPLAWSELSRLRAASQFTIANVKARLKKPDPWQDFDASRVDLRKWVHNF